MNYKDFIFTEGNEDISEANSNNTVEFVGNKIKLSKSTQKRVRTTEDNKEFKGDSLFREFMESLRDCHLIGPIIATLVTATMILAVLINFTHSITQNGIDRLNEGIRQIEENNISNTETKEINTAESFSSTIIKDSNGDVKGVVFEEKEK